ncbi:MAG: ABC transporter permease [Acidobacteriota bacterium]|jgi:phospholipid/cholesterol/gamma-HCH transport system permease protein|nr:ABC transporter permease [Acidobacteriota bacterium]
MKKSLLMRALGAPWRFILRALWDIQSYTRLGARAVANVFTPPIYLRETILQMDRIGIGSLTIVVLTGFFTGAVMAIQSEGALRRYGAVGMTGQLVALTIIRELGPVLSALMLAGRIGAGIASELGSMVVSEQISAMRALGTDPTRRLVTPRVLAMVVMLPLLTVVCDSVGMLGGWLIASYKLLISSSQYWSDAMNAMAFSDVVGTLVKPVVFGLIIATTGCYIGLRTSGGTEGVGKSTTQAVVSSSILVIAADFFLNNILIYLAPLMNR